MFTVYFIYPETAGIRLEDMDALFGDATTAMPTPALEAGSLRGANSPIPPMDLRRGMYGSSPGPSNGNGLGPANAIPGLEIDPPHVSIVNGKPQYAGDDDSTNEGVGGWISRMVKRTKDGGSIRSGKSGRSGSYKPVDQDEGE